MSFGGPGPPREREGTESETHFPACGTRLSNCANTAALVLGHEVRDHAPAHYINRQRELFVRDRGFVRSYPGLWAIEE